MMTLSQLLLPAPADLSARVADALADENVVLQGGGIAFPAGGWRLLPAAVGRHLGCRYGDRNARQPAIEGGLKDVIEVGGAGCGRGGLGGD